MAFGIEPSSLFKSVTPSDTIPLQYGTGTTSNTYNQLKARALYIGVAGNVAVKDDNGNTTTFSNVPVGLLRVSPAYVMATNTTATSIVALF